MNQDILVKVFGKIEKFSPRGIGAYPYECRTKDKHPNSMVYVSESGGWIASHDLKATNDGYFIYIFTKD